MGMNENSQLITICYYEINHKTGFAKTQYNPATSKIQSYYKSDSLALSNTLMRELQIAIGLPSLASF